MTTQTTITAGSRVAKQVTRTEFYTGEIRIVKGTKALVYFTSRNISRWCNISNLELIK